MKRFAKLLVLGALVVAATPAAAQTVRDGITAWQKSDYAKAVAVWRPLAEGGDADAQFNLAQAYRLGRGVGINLAVAQTWFERSARQGHVDAQTTLGLLLFQNGSQTEGINWLGQAAEMGEPRAMLIYGTALVNGDSVQQDPVLGYAYVSRSAAQGLGPAKETLAQLDDILPLASRQKGLDLAKAKARTAPPPGSKPVRKTAAKKDKPKPAEKPAEVAEKKAGPTAPKASASGNWRVQLGAFGQKSAAEALFRKLSGKLSGRQAYYTPVGSVTRLQAGPFESKAAANTACASLAPQPCFAVEAR